MKPPREPSAARAHARETAPAVDGRAEAAARRYFDALGPQWPLTAAQRDRLTPAVEAAVADGWTPDRLAAFTGANSTGVRNPYAVLSARLSPDQLPAAPASPSMRPSWCGQCDPQCRFLLDEFGYPSAIPCPKCRQEGPERRRAVLPRVPASQSAATPSAERLPADPGLAVGSTGISYVAGYASFPCGDRR
jgi:hypothetical protein